CRASYSVSDAALGRTGRCRQCGQRFTVETASDPGDPPTAGPGLGETPAPPPELAPGSSFGRYRIIRRLGRGGMGVVYLAHDTELDRPIALKIPHFTAEDGPEFFRRFFREARAAAGFDHPNL